MYQDASLYGDLRPPFRNYNRVVFKFNNERQISFYPNDGNRWNPFEYASYIDEGVNYKKHYYKLRYHITSEMYEAAEPIEESEE